MDDWLSIYVNSLKRIIDENQKFLETEGKILRDVIKNYIETWATIDDIVSRIDRNGSTVMHFAVYHMWFPSGGILYYLRCAVQRHWRSVKSS